MTYGSECLSSVARCCVLCLIRFWYKWTNEIFFFLFLELAVLLKLSLILWTSDMNYYKNDLWFWWNIIRFGIHRDETSWHVCLNMDAAIDGLILMEIWKEVNTKRRLVKIFDLRIFCRVSNQNFGDGSRIIQTELNCSKIWRIVWPISVRNRLRSIHISNEFCCIQILQYSLLFCLHLFIISKTAFELKRYCCRSDFQIIKIISKWTTVDRMLHIILHFNKQRNIFYTFFFLFIFCKIQNMFFFFLISFSLILSC